MRQPTYDQLKTRYDQLGFVMPEFSTVAIRSKANVQNKFDDLLGYIHNGTVVWHTGTTNSGNKPLLAPTHPLGVAIICADQQVIDYAGFHLHTGKYLCLGQRKSINYQRDNDKDGTHESVGKVYSDIRGFNQHRANENAQSENVENWSEGCMVRNNPVQYKEFLNACIEYYQSKTGLKFDPDKLPEFRFTFTILNEWLISL